MNFPDFASLVSSFTGANENPLSEGGNWAKLDAAGIALQRTSNAVTSSGTTTGESYWTPNNFGPDLQAFITIPTLPGTGNSVRIYVRIQQEGGTNTWDGYSVRYQQAATSQLFLDSVTNNAITSLASPNVTLSAGDKIGISCIGSQLETWSFSGGVWTMRSQVTDATYPNAGKVAVAVRNTTGRADDFFCATMLPADNVLQIIG